MYERKTRRKKEKIRESSDHCIPAVPGDSLFEAVFFALV